MLSLTHWFEPIIKCCYGDCTGFDWFVPVCYWLNVVAPPIFLQPHCSLSQVQMLLFTHLHCVGPCIVASAFWLLLSVHGPFCVSHGRQIQWDAELGVLAQSLLYMHVPCWQMHSVSTQLIPHKHQEIRSAKGYCVFYTPWLWLGLITRLFCTLCFSNA